MAQKIIQADKAPFPIPWPEATAANHAFAVEYYCEATKKIEDPRNDPTTRQKRKKVKRLERKVAKITATEKMAEEKKKPKKERKSATEA